MMATSEDSISVFESMLKLTRNVKFRQKKCVLTLISREHF